MLNINKLGEVDILGSESESTASVLIGGDLYLHGALLAAVEGGRTREIFDDILPEIESSDFSIVNLEAPCTDISEPISKSGPPLKMPYRAVNVLTDLGLDAVTLANNHIGDYTPQGVLDTIRVLNAKKIKYAGAGKDLIAAATPLKWKKNGLACAIISIAENEFGIAEQSIPGVAPFDIVENLRLIAKTAAEVDVLIVIAHGGIENYPLPRPGLIKLFRAFADAGATAVVAHHPHCAQGLEIWNDTPIVYSLGNFAFPSLNQKTLRPSSLWNFGYMMKIDFSEKQACKLKIIPYSQFADGKNWRILKESQLKRFLSYFSEISEIIRDEYKVRRFLDAWTFLNQKRLIEWLNWRIIPGDMEQIAHIKNEFYCESHYELAKNLLMLMHKKQLSEASEFAPQLKIFSQNNF